MKIFKITHKNTGWNCIVNAENLVHANALFFQGHYLFGTEHESNFSFELLHEIHNNKSIFQQHIEKIEDKIKTNDSNLRLHIYNSLNISNLPIDEIKNKVEEILTYIKTGK